MEVLQIGISNNNSTNSDLNEIIVHVKTKNSCRLVTMKTVVYV